MTSLDFVGDPDMKEEDFTTPVKEMYDDAERQAFGDGAEDYKKELEEISSYEALLKRKEVGEKKKELNRFVNIISNRASALLAQSLYEKAEDKLGKTSDFYKEVVNKVKGEPDKFLGGDIDKQHKLFELFVSTDSTNPRAVEHILSDIEGILKKKV